MRCGEAREYMFAFLDSELETPLSIDLQLHLDGCPDCAREAEIERTIHKRLEHTMVGTGDGIPAFSGWLGPQIAFDEQSVHGVGPAIVRRNVRWAQLAAVAAAVLIVFGAVLWYSLGLGSSTVANMALAQLVVDDFGHFLSEGRHLQIESSDRDSVASWLKEKTALAVSLPKTGHHSDPAARQGCKLLGGRKCTLEGRPAAFAVYDMHGTPASLVIVEAGDAVLEGMTTIEFQGTTHLVDHREGYTIVARRQGSLVYAAVSSLPETKLFCLVTETSYESH